MISLQHDMIHAASIDARRAALRLLIVPELGERRLTSQGATGRQSGIVYLSCLGLARLDAAGAEGPKTTLPPDERDFVPEARWSRDCLFSLTLSVLGG